MGARPAPLAIVVRDQTPLRGGPRDSALQQALLWQGEVVEVRGEKLDYLQVWDYRRERGGFVEASRVRRTALAAGDAPELMAVLRFVRETPGAEALGIGFAAAWLKAATPEMLRGEGGAEAFDAIGTMADRLAQRASAVPISPGAAPSRGETALSAHLEVASRYGVAIRSYEREGAIRLCYDGEAFRRVLALPAEAKQRARAALGLTRPECIDPQAGVVEREQIDLWRAQVLDRVDLAELPPTWRNRVAMRRAGVWSGLAYRHARKGEAAQAEAAAKRALAELGEVDRAELADDDLGGYVDAAIRVNASRWAAAPAGAKAARGVSIVTVAGEAGETCVLLVDAQRGAASPLARRCTFGLVWDGSATLNREGNALALAVQPMEAWRELWLFRRQPGGGWVVQVLPPSSATPGLGYAEFAGWVPGGRQVLVAREARAEGRARRSFEVVGLATLATERQTADPSTLGPFQRWQDPAWKRETVSLR
ncbi:MAG: hypothetical protein K8R60_14375 [Burkholderiales bacterium]|nr:hypothetical protein [Burkholderiales bacterium]